MAYKYITREDFSSLDQLMRELGKRKNNKFMRNKFGSKEGDEGFTGTKSWEEAIDLLANGYTDILSQMKSDVKAKSKITSNSMATVNHPIPRTAIVGYSPCVPNAILGLPNSMITVERVPMKRKTLSILYQMGACANEAPSFFEEAGAALLSAINLIEMAGIQTQLKLCFFPAQKNDELLFPTVVIKNYGERFSLQKVSFPLAHTSMFRRIGFKWLETSPDVKTDFSIGYGRPTAESSEELSGILSLDKNTRLINIRDIHKVKCSVEEILKLLGVM